MATHWAIREVGGGYCTGVNAGGPWFGGSEWDAVRWGTRKAATEALQSHPGFAILECKVVKLVSKEAS